MTQMTTTLPPARVAATEPLRPQRSRLRQALRHYFRLPAPTIGLLVLTVVALACIAAPLLTPYRFDKIAPADAYSAPSAEHLMGTDKFGRDIFTRILYGGRISLQVGLLATAIGMTIGVTAGMLAGYMGGYVDEAIMRVLDIMLAFPGILLAMTVVAVLGPGLYNLMIAVGIGSIPAFARLVRSSVLSGKEMDYVLAANAMGARSSRIMWLHIMPNIAAPLIVFSTLNVASAVLAGAALNFLGLGAKPPSPEWGIMLADARETLNRAWWASLFPGLAILTVSLCINFIGDGLRAVLDPRMRER
jgi:peptide/nickel transport system permease protein